MNGLPGFSTDARNRLSCLSRTLEMVRRRARTADAVELLEERRLLAAHVLGSPTAYSTIQAAVNAAAPGGTVTVDAGTYPELVTIGKSLTVLGAESGIDA